MLNSNLLNMYQAWMQGNENYIRDWYNFVEWAAHWNGTTVERTLEELSKYKWFKKGD